MRNEREKEWKIEGRKERKKEDEGNKGRKEVRKKEKHEGRKEEHEKRRVVIVGTRNVEFKTKNKNKK